MAKVKTFTAGYGFSGSINGQWHKFNTEITIEIEPGDNIAEIKEVLSKHKELTFDFHEIPDAPEYRDTLLIEK